MGQGRGGNNSQVVVEYKKVLSSILHDVLAEVLNKRPYGNRAAIPVGGWHVKRVAASVGKEHLKSTTVECL